MEQTKWVIKFVKIVLLFLCDLCKKSVEKIKEYCTKGRIDCDNRPVAITNYIKRPEKSIFDKNIFSQFSNEHSRDAFFTAETDIKYEGYVKIENLRVAKIKSLENVLIPYQFKYESLTGLSGESREKLVCIRPETLGQASRLAGVRPSDIGILAIYLQLEEKWLVLIMTQDCVWLGVKVILI